jgi:hypothetical protein
MNAVSVHELLVFRSGAGLALVIVLVALRGLLRLVTGPLAVVLVLLDVAVAALDRAVVAVPESVPRVRMVRVRPVDDRR